MRNLVSSFLLDFLSSKMAIKYILDFEACKKYFSWVYGTENDKEDTARTAFFRILDVSISQMCSGETPQMCINYAILKKLEDYCKDEDITPLQKDTLINGVKFENVDVDGLTTSQSIIKQASMSEFFEEDYVVICGSSIVYTKLIERTLRCKRLSELR